MRVTATDAWEGLSALPAFAGDFLSDGGEMGAATRAFDWTRTSLGHPDAWPQSLKNVTRLVLTSGQPMCFWWGPELLNLHNDAYVPMLGKRAEGALGQPFRILWADVWDGVYPFVRKALSGEGTWIEDLPLVTTRNGYPEQTFWTFSYSPLHDDEGRINGILNIVTETTTAVADRAALEKANVSLAESMQEAERLIEAQRHYERQQRVLQRELSHRMKNTLSVVQSIVSQTMRHTASMQEANDTIAGRIAALSRAQDILTETSGRSADVGHVVRNALDPYLGGTNHFDISGPRAEISAQQALGISLAVHELATNAVKYGALSTGHGKVAIAWSLDPGGEFHFEWRESGGPPVIPPSRRGFGSRLTERIVAAYFSGAAQILYEPSGIVFVLDGHREEDSED